MLAALAGCDKKPGAAEAEQPSDASGMTMGTSPGAGPATPVQPDSSMGGNGGSTQSGIPKNRARSAAAKAGQGSVGGYTDGE